MNTLILTEKQKLREETRVLPQPELGEVIIEVAYCGICRTDRKCFRIGQRDLHMPRVLGHEFSGIVAQVGVGVTDLAVGDRVGVYPGLGCGSCEDCLQGNDQRCASMKIIGFHLDGGFSRYCRISAEGVQRGQIVKLPEHLSLETAAMGEPLGCALHMLESFDFCQIRSVWICGGGVLGFMMAALCQYFGAELVLISEPEEVKRSLWAESGFDVVHPGEVDTYLSARNMPGFDAVIPCYPSTDCFEEGLKNVKNGGYFGFFSGLVGDSTIPLKILNLIHYKELKIVGTYGCGKKDYLQAIKLLSEGFDLSAVPIKKVSLKEAANVLCQEETQDSVLTMIDYDKEDQK